MTDTKEPETISERYMIRRKFFVPKNERTRSYRYEGDPRPCDFFIEEVKVDETEWH